MGSGIAIEGQSETPFPFIHGPQLIRDLLKSPKETLLGMLNALFLDADFHSCIPPPYLNPLPAIPDFQKPESGRLDLNQRPPAPKAGALPGCATPRMKKLQGERGYA